MNRKKTRIPTPILIMLLWMLFCLLLTSCDIQKRAVKTKKNTAKTIEQVDKNDITTQSSTVTQRYLPSGSITTDLLPIEQRPIDENGELKKLIQKIKDGPLTKTIIYKPDGSSQVKCDVDAIVERTVKEVLQVDNSTSDKKETTTEDLKEKEREKEENFDAAALLYAIVGVGLGLGLLIAVGGGILFWLLKKMLTDQASQFQSLINTVVK